MERFTVCGKQVHGLKKRNYDTDVIFWTSPFTLRALQHFLHRRVAINLNENLQSEPDYSVADGYHFYSAWFMRKCMFKRAYACVCGFLWARAAIPVSADTPELVFYFSCLFINLSVCISSTCLSFCPPAWLHVCLPSYLHVCMYISLTLFINFSRLSRRQDTSRFPFSPAFLHILLHYTYRLAPRWAVRLLSAFFIFLRE